MNTTSTGNILLRIETRDGQTRWRPLVDTRDETLLAQGGLDPVRHFVDLPKSAHVIRPGDASVLAQGRVIEGAIRDRETKRCVGVITFARDGERFPDRDPADPARYDRFG
jgi:hypothetical protein